MFIERIKWPITYLVYVECNIKSLLLRAVTDALTLISDLHVETFIILINTI